MPHFLSDYGPRDPNYIGEGHITFLPWSYTSITQGTWVFYNTSSQFCNGYLYNSTATNLDRINFKAFLSKGTYTLTVLSRKSPVQGILEILIDGVSIATLDQYNPTALFNQIDRITPINIQSDGIKTISLQCQNKNPASPSYLINFTGFTLTKIT